MAAVLPVSGRFVVARLDGTRMANAGHVFYGFSDALLFPSYFGWNWNALSDRLRDLHWLPADGYLVIVDNAPLYEHPRIELCHPFGCATLSKS
ncbi:barstar family protein [Micromonospora gifhornensis]|nr:barstar family protein [Micromonospora gifhornensis]